MRRLYFFELFALANFALVALVGRGTMAYAGSLLLHLIAFCVGMLPQLLAGVAVRSLIALARGDRAYFTVIRSREWIGDTVRIIVGTALMIYSYGWLKLIVPIRHARLFDQELWDLDRALFFGLSPTVFFLDMFSAPAALRFIDWSYAKVFYASMVLAFAYFLSEPSRRIRIAFTNGNSALWIASAWLYLLVPSVGPAFRFPDVWMPYEHALRQTQSLQAVLMRNYNDVIRAASGQPTRSTIRIVFGVAAFPSMHVAFQTYMFLWMRRLWTGGEVLFAIFALTIFLGSMVTGWHYMIDGLFAMLMAWAAYAVVSRVAMKEQP